MGWKSNIGLTQAQSDKLDKIAVGVKSNLNATTAPTAADDLSEGYSVGSSWVFNNITYLCTDPNNPAVWVSTADMYYFDTWTLLVAAISVTGSTYVNKFATVSNANGGTAGGTTYTAPAALTNPIVDGGSAIYKINAQGTSYSVTAQARAITNPVVTSVMLIAAAKPTTAGYYIFAVTPTNGLPAGVGINDIAYFDGTKWSVWQTYAAANTVLVIGTTTNTQITWRKFNGTWMSTADDYVPDTKEYQTGKLWNGKAVYRRCTAGTLGASGVNLDTGMFKPVAGTMLLAFCSVNYMGTRWLTFSSRGDADVFIDETNDLRILTTNSAFVSRPYTAWMEYTKS